MRRRGRRPRPCRRSRQPAGPSHLAWRPSPGRRPWFAAAQLARLSSARRHAAYLTGLPRLRPADPPPASAHHIAATTVIHECCIFPLLRHDTEYYTLNERCAAPLPPRWTTWLRRSSWCGWRPTTPTTACRCRPTRSARRVQRAGEGGRGGRSWALCWAHGTCGTGVGRMTGFEGCDTAALPAIYRPQGPRRGRVVPGGPHGPCMDRTGVKASLTHRVRLPTPQHRPPRLRTAQHLMGDIAVHPAPCPPVPPPAGPLQPLGRRHHRQQGGERGRAQVAGGARRAAGGQERRGGGLRGAAEAAAGAGERAGGEGYWGSRQEEQGGRGQDSQLPNWHPCVFRVEIWGCGMGSAWERSPRPPPALLPRRCGRRWTR